MRDALARARSALAHAALALPADAPAPALGPFTLHPHQQLAVARLRQLLATAGGALLADDVGMGKTLVALALAREAARPLVVAPAAVRPVWQRATRETGVAAPFVSLESLARGRHVAPPDLLIVDEAHHARSPATRGWRALAALAAHARVLLLTATPVHNRRRDLAALLALFLGAHAHRLPRAALTALVVRRCPADLADDARRAAGPRPRVHATVWHPLPADPGRLAALLALPPPVPPSDGAPADALHAVTLVRAWTSSDAALTAALRRRLARATALADACAQGRTLDARTLRAWCPDPAGAVVQPDLPLDAPAPRGAPSDDASATRPLGTPRRASTVARATDAATTDALAAHAAALRALLDRTTRDGTPRDDARVALLRTLRARHPGASIVAFTHSADTARALYRRLAPDGRVALLTAAGGRIASGPLARRDLLARFAPLGSGTARVNGRNACAVQLRIA